MSAVNELEKGEKAERLLRLEPSQASAELAGLSLEKQLELLLELPPGKKRLELVLLSQRPAQLVGAMAPEDFLLTIKALGEEDALELLEYSTDEQTTYLADLELWQEDRLHLGRLARWNELMSRCSPERFGRWLEAFDFEVLALLFERTLTMIDREAVLDLTDEQSARLLTPDHYHYFLAREGADPQLLRKLVDFLFSEKRELFFALAGNLGTNPPVEVEELALRFRLARLSERGWPEPEEAFTIYTPRQLQSAVAAELPAGFENPPRCALEAAFGGELLGAAARRMEKREILASQLANLTNRVLLADHLPLSSPESWKRAAAKVVGYLTIALRSLGAGEPTAAASLLGRVPLLHLFQAAVFQVQERVRRAKELVRQAPEKWRSLLDSPLDGILDGLLGERPSYFVAESLERRDFERLEDLLVLDRQLDLVEAFLRLSLAVGVRPAELPRPFPAGWHPEDFEGLSLSMLLLTAFARHRLGLEPKQEPVPFSALPRLVEEVPADDFTRRRLLSAWAVKMLGAQPAGLDSLVGVLSELLGQLRSLPPEGLDARFVGLLWWQAEVRSGL